MRQLNERIEEILQEEKRLGLLVRAMRKEPDLLSFTLTEAAGNKLTLENPQLMELFRKNKRMICSIAIFHEFLKEVACTL